MIFKFINTIAIITILLPKVFGDKMNRACVDKSNNITVSWNKLQDTCNNFYSYELFGQENVSSPFKSLYKTENFYENSYLLVNGASVSVTWRFFIVVEYFCGNKVYKNYDTIQIDNIPPEGVNIDSVSIVNEKINIGWDECKSSDVMGYIIYFVDENNKNIPIKTLYGKKNTYFIDTSERKIKENVNRYRIVAFDSCENYSTISADHVTVLLNITQNYCNSSVVLNWTHYLAWPSSEREYEIIIKKVDDNQKIFFMVDGEMSNFLINNLKNKENYTFIIRVKNKKLNITATSNELKLKTNFVENPDYIYISTVTVIDSNIMIEWKKNKDIEINGYKIYVEDLKSNVTKTYTTNFNYYLDKHSKVYRQYEYQISAINKCNEEVALSKKVKNIVLSKKEGDLYYILSWNKYIWFDGNSDYQELFQYDNDTNLWKINKILSEEKTILTTGLSKESLAGSKKCFYIVQNEKDTNSFGIKMSAKSNTVCIIGDPLVFFPNAFFPNSEIEENKSFKIIGSNILYEGSTLTVYDRWGEKIINIDDLKMGWDGKSVNGNGLQPGIYYYIANIIGENGKKLIYNGTINLLK